MKIKKGDEVVVIAGKDRGKKGKVLAAIPTENKVIVEGINRVTKHEKAGATARGTRTGGLVHTEAAIHVSNVAVVDPDSKKPTRIKTRVETVERNGRQKANRIRVAVRSGKDL